MVKYSTRYLALSLFILITVFCGNDPSVNNSQPTNMNQIAMLEADNPKVQGIVNKVSEDSLGLYISKLVSFFTRHTNSDTVSATRGIGAARRWVFGKFKSFSEREGGRLQVYYHDFDATVRGVFGFHRNVIAELPGTLTPDRKFVVSGHLDSRNSDNSDAVGFAAGANDDGSGVAAAIELARILSEFEFESTLIFVAFTGEDQGLFGSRAYAQDLRESNTNIVGMVTNDIIGNIVGGSGNVDSLNVRCFSADQPDSRHRQLARYVKIQGDAYVPGFTVNLILSRDRPGRGGDHFGFNKQGYTAARLTEPEDNLAHQHNMNDLPEFMSFPYLTKVVKINSAYLATWADAPDIPKNVQARSQSGGQQRISWDASNRQDFEKYLVSLRSPTSITYDSLITVGNENEFFLSTSPGVFISISAVDRDGNESIFSNEVLVQ